MHKNPFAATCGDFGVICCAHVQNKCIITRATTGSPSSKYVVYATACVYRELYGKITDRKKKLCK